VSARFHWHPEARLFGPDGVEVAQGEAGAAVIPAEPAGRALAAALVCEGAFRIGGSGPAPNAAAVPMFESLTSGSTAAPRRIWRSQASWTASFSVNGRAFGIGPGRVVAVLGGLAQSLALYGALEGMHLGATVHLLGGMRPDRQAQALETRGVQVLYATPAQLRGLGGIMPNLRLILVGGSKLDAALRVDLRRLAPGAALREFYGAAETSFITLADEDTPEGSVGRAYPGVEMDIRAGEVWVKSPYLFKGYAGEVGSACWDDNWLSVGEMGQVQDGYLYLQGRKGRMVTVADQNVFPEEIEALMLTLPGVTQAAVLAQPDAARGHVLQAVVMGDRGQEAAILAALRAALGPTKAPRWIVWRDDWPVTASGKTDFAALEAG